MNIISLPTDVLNLIFIEIPEEAGILKRICRLFNEVVNNPLFQVQAITKIMGTDKLFKNGRFDEKFIRRQSLGFTKKLFSLLSRMGSKDACVNLALIAPNDAYVSTRNMKNSIFEKLLPILYPNWSWDLKKWWRDSKQVQVHLSWDALNEECRIQERKSDPNAHPAGYHASILGSDADERNIDKA